MDVNYVFLNVRFFQWFDAIAVFEAGKSLIYKVYWGKEWLHGLYILWRLTVVGEYKRVIVFSLEVTLERVCWPYKWKCEQEKVLEDEVFIENTCLEVGFKNAGRNSNEDVVLNIDHVVLLVSDFPRLNICVRPPSFFREQVAYHPF